MKEKMQEEAVKPAFTGILVQEQAARFQKPEEVEKNSTEPEKITDTLNYHGEDSLVDSVITRHPNHKAYNKPHKDARVFRKDAPVTHMNTPNSPRKDAVKGVDVVGEDQYGGPKKYKGFSAEQLALQVGDSVGSWKTGHALSPVVQAALDVREEHLMAWFENLLAPLGLCLEPDEYDVHLAKLPSSSLAQLQAAIMNMDYHKQQQGDLLEAVLDSQRPKQSAPPVLTDEHRADLGMRGEEYEHNRQRQEEVLKAHPMAGVELGEPGELEEVLASKLPEPAEEVEVQKINGPFAAPYQKTVQPGDLQSIATKLGAMLEEKNAAYGSAFEKAGEYLKLLYEDGIEPHEYARMLVLVRDFDKSVRIATNQDAFGEDPFMDKAGYGILGSTLRR